MVALERGRSLAFLLFTLLVVLGLGIFGYLTIRALPESKAAAERFLMIAALLAVLSSVVAVGVYRRSRNLDQTLRRALARTAQSGFSVRGYFASANLGEMGRLLSEIFSQLEELSEKKSLRIGALNTLNQTVLNLLSEAVIVTNAEGTIFQWSKPAARREAEGAAPEEESGMLPLGESPITSRLSGLDIEVMVNHFYRERSAYRYAGPEGEATVYPVFDARGNLTYSLFILGSEVDLNVPKPDSRPKKGHPEGEKRRTPLSGMGRRIADTIQSFRGGPGSARNRNSRKG